MACTHILAVSFYSVLQFILGLLLTHITVSSSSKHPRNSFIVVRVNPSVLKCFSQLFGIWISIKQNLPVSADNTSRKRNIIAFYDRPPYENIDCGYHSRLFLFYFLILQNYWERFNDISISGMGWGDDVINGLLNWLSLVHTNEYF